MRQTVGPQSDPANVLPAEIMMEVFSYLNPRDLNNARLVSHAWTDLAGTTVIRDVTARIHAAIKPAVHHIWLPDDLAKEIAAKLVDDVALALKEITSSQGKMALLQLSSEQQQDVCRTFTAAADCLECNMLQSNDADFPSILILIADLRSYVGRLKELREVQ